VRPVVLSHVYSRFSLCALAVLGAGCLRSLCLPASSTCLCASFLLIGFPSAQYTMNVSSRGSEGLFSSLASAPLFSVKLVVGAMSGILLTDYCPSLGHCDSQRLWSIVGATSLLSPILMVFLRSCIESRGSEDRDSDGGAAMAAAAASKPAALDAGGGPTEATALLPRSRADVYPTTTAEAVRVDVASLDQGKAVFAKSRPMAIPDEG